MQLKSSGMRFGAPGLLLAFGLGIVVILHNLPLLGKVFYELSIIIFDGSVAGILKIM